MKNFRHLFFGDIVRAHETVKKLGDQTELNDRERRDLEIAHTILKASGGIRTSISSLEHDDVGDISPNLFRVHETEKEEKITDELIVSVEQGAYDLEEALREHCETRRSHDDTREVFFEPFDFVKINVLNPGKNAARFGRQHPENSSQIVFQGDPHWFQYRIVEPGGQMSFSPPTRMMSIPSDFDPQIYLDTLNLFHELCYVREDTRIRKDIHSTEDRERYFHFFDAAARRYPVFESALAYAYEIEGLNILLENALKDAAVKNLSLDRFQIAEKLHIAKDDRKRIVRLLVILAIAKDFYASGSSLHQGITKQFTDALVARIQSYGGDDLVFVEKMDIHHPRLYK